MIIIFVHGLRDIAIKFEHQINLARREQILAIIFMKRFHEWFLLDHQRFNLGQISRGQRVHRFAEIFPYSRNMSPASESQAMRFLY